MAIDSDALGTSSPCRARKRQRSSPEGPRPPAGSIRLRRTDPERAGAVVYSARDTTRIVRAWLDGGAIADGFLFRSLSRTGTPGRSLDPSQIPRIFKAMARAAGLPEDVVAGISGHSARVGATQDMIASGVELAAILQAGRWKTTAMVYRYGERLMARRSGAGRGGAAACSAGSGTASRGGAAQLASLQRRKWGRRAGRRFRPDIDHTTPTRLRAPRPGPTALAAGLSQSTVSSRLPRPGRPGDSTPDTSPSSHRRWPPSGRRTAATLVCVDGAWGSGGQVRLPGHPRPRRGRRRGEDPMTRSVPAVRQIRPRAAMLTVPVRDTTMWSNSRTSISSRSSFVRLVRLMSLRLGSSTSDGWLWYAMTAATL